jgi:hypothetical protein
MTGDRDQQGRETVESPSQLRLFVAVSGMLPTIYCTLADLLSWAPFPEVGCPRSSDLGLDIPQWPGVPRGGGSLSPGWACGVGTRLRGYWPLLPQDGPVSHLLEVRRAPGCVTLPSFSCVPLHPILVAVCSCSITPGPGVVLEGTAFLVFSRGGTAAQGGPPISFSPPPRQCLLRTSLRLMERPWWGSSEHCRSQHLCRACC